MAIRFADRCWLVIATIGLGGGGGALADHPERSYGLPWDFSQPPRYSVKRAV
jgi:hypothetical protein